MPRGFAHPCTQPAVAAHVLARSVHMTRRRPLPVRLQFAPFSIHEAAAQGVSRNRLRASDLSAPFRGTRAQAGETALRTRCEAFSLVMGPHQVFAGPTAAGLWGIPLPLRLAREARLHVLTVGQDWASSAQGVIGSRTAGPVTQEVMHGLRLTDAASTWCALAGRLSVDELIEAGDRLLGRPLPLASSEQIDAAIAAYGSRRGIRRLREARPQLRAGSESPRETRLRLVVVRGGLPEPEPNGVIALRGGRSTHGDLVFRAFKVLLEYDGQHHREDAGQWARDVVRLNDLAEAGWLVIRITKETPRAEILARTERALRDRGWRP